MLLLKILHIFLEILTLTVVRFAFFQAVFGLSIDPNDSKEDSESVSISAKVRSPILEILLMEDFRSSTDPPLYIDELQE